MPRRLTFILLALAALSRCQHAAAQPTTTPVKDKAEPAAQQDADAPGRHWVRILRDKQNEPLAMQVAIVRYVDARQIVPGQSAEKYDRYVDLVGAVHIGDKKYYGQLNDRFKTYNKVLYELVAPEGTVVPRGRGTSNSHPLGALQNAMKSALEVEHQLEQIDYTRPNFIHADMSPDEFFASMKDRQETFLTMYLRMIGASLAQQSQQAAEGESSDMDLLAALFSDDRPRLLKVAMAKQFEGMESLLVGFSGPDGSTLITERNRRALDVLQKRLTAGDKRLAIFYGAGHLADMHEQMEKRFGMKPVGTEWLEAWDLRKK